jgi:hypothetical protein
VSTIECYGHCAPRYWSFLAIAGGLIRPVVIALGSLVFVGAAMSVGLKRSDSTVTMVHCRVADGGEGTLSTVLAAGFERSRCERDAGGRRWVGDSSRVLFVTNASRGQPRDAR